MPRPKGLPKTGGRRPGTPNSRTVMLTDLLYNLDCDIPKKLVSILPLLTPDKQADVLLDLLQYVFPKRKAIEIAPVNKGHIEGDNLRTTFLDIISDEETFKAAELVAERLAETRGKSS